MEYKKALDKCMGICSQREYCIFDIEEKLMKWEVSMSEHQKIVKVLIDERFIDHDRYVPAFINDKFTFNHWGKIKIRYYLKQKRIEESIIKKYLNTIDEDTYDLTIRNEIEKKRRSVKGNSPFEINQKIAKYVISKGFEPNKVFEILKLP